MPDKYFNKYKAKGLDDKTACVYAMCENLDDNIGRILDRLDRLGLSENTIVMFLTDNGPNTDRFNGGMKGRKGSVHEGGIRVPFFVRWPGRIDAGKAIPQIAAHIDLFQTIVELCGVSMPRTLPQDGRSLAPLLTDDAVEWEDRMIFTFRSPGGNTDNLPGSVRTQRWRAVKGRKKWELYDMAADPSQQRDVAAEQPDVVERLRAAFEQAAADVTSKGFDPLPIPIGHIGWPEVTMPGHEAYLEPANREGISYHGRSGWCNDYITNWTSTDACAWWPVEVVRAGRYKVELLYTCPIEHLGATIQVQIGPKRVEGAIDRSHDPESVPSPDRVPRKEVYEKVWAVQSLGIIELESGRTKCLVRTLDMPAGRSIDLKAVRVRRIR